ISGSSSATMKAEYGGGDGPEAHPAASSNAIITALYRRLFIGVSVARRRVAPRKKAAQKTWAA
ncbi:MAG: hypothetical protein OEO82_14280, partial [Gammaproteobacteria bacterium]|nr:hypothetical protein [Gammaproteobacteria bacterium]